MRKIFFSILLITSTAGSLFSQTDLSGIKIFVNPGHGGYDSNDRHMLTTDFWESEGNLVKGLYLRELLENLNATVYMSRTTNTTEDDLALSTISEMANAANVDFFLSIHSNGYAGTQNQPLVLFRGYDNAPVYPESKNMAVIVWQKLFEKGNCWTSSSQWVKGDWTFYPEWGTQGLGVLRGLTMPGVLSEGSFHDYIPESWRLRNTDFLHHETWAFIRSFVQYYNATPPSTGVIAGVVRDTLLTPSWYFKTGTRDEKLPLNGVKVTLTPGNKVYQVDNLNNGFFFYDSVSPGTYKIYFDGIADYYRDSLMVTVNANATTLADFYMQYDTTKVPDVIDFQPSSADSVLFNQELSVTFSLPMNPDSVTKAVSVTPATELSFSWDKEYKVLKIKPVIGYLSKTSYTLTISPVACSRWKVKIPADRVHNFVTFYRQHLKVEGTFPSEELTGVTIYPQVRVYFDSPVDHSSASAAITITNSQGQPLTKVREQFTESGGKGTYFFETEQPLSLNSSYTVTMEGGLTDQTGVKLGTPVTIPFSTRASAYPEGTMVESYETISSFWDPEASGSTVGTDNPLTTFTASTDVKYSGNTAGRLNYVFTGASGGVCRVFDTSKPSVGSTMTSSFGIWVFGDYSKNILEYWFYANGSTNKIVFADTIDWAGWDFKPIPLSQIGATGTIQFHSTVLRQTEIGAKEGTIWFDNAIVYVPTAVDDVTAERTDATLCPNPLNTQGVARVDLSETSVVTMSIYTLDGRKVDGVAAREYDPGVQEIVWVPAASLVNGVYLVRIDIRPLRGGPVTVASGRWILSR